MGDLKKYIATRKKADKAFAEGFEDQDLRPAEVFKIYPHDLLFDPLGCLKYIHMT